MTIKIYHNPKCSKSRQALELVQNSGEAFDVVEYLKAELSLEEIKNIFQSYAGEHKDFVRTGGGEYKEDPFELSDRDLVAQKLIETPKLLQRPIVIKGGVAVIGRPRENIESLLKGRV